MKSIVTIGQQKESCKYRQKRNFNSNVWLCGHKLQLQREAFSRLIPQRIAIDQMGENVRMSIVNKLPPI